MVDTMQKVQTAGGITKTYVIRDGVLGNVSGSKFYPLSDYELTHDVSNIKRDAAGKVTFYTLSGADTAQYEAAQAAATAAQKAKAAQLLKEAAAREAAAQAAQKAATAKAAIDPQKTSGYAFKYTLSHADQNTFVREKQSNPKLTEYQWRKANGKDLAVVKGTYVAPKLTTTNKSAASTGTKQTGVSKDLTGSQKIAAQSKTNASTNKATVVKKTTTTPAKTTTKTTPAKTVTPTKTTVTPTKAKTVVSLDAAKSGNAAKTTPKPAVKTPVKTPVKTVAKPTTGVSKDLTGSQKIAAQSKINSSTNKPTIVVKKPVQQTPVQPAPVVTKKPSFQLTPLQPTATPIIVKKTTTTTAQTTPKKSFISNIFGPDKSGFGIIGVASAKITAEDRQKYTKDPRFKPCPTGLCSIKWTNDQITKLKAADAQASQTQTVQTPKQTQTQTQQRIQTQTTQIKQIQTQVQVPTQTQTQVQTPTYITYQTESQPIREQEDEQWHEAVQDILKQDMMRKYGLDSRGNKIISSSTGTPIQLADGSYVEQVQKQGNSRDSGVKILTADSRITKEQRDELYQQKLAGNYNPTAVKVTYVADGKNKITHGTVTNQVKADQIANTKAAQEAAAAKTAALQAAFTGNTKIGKSGEVIDAIQSRGNDSTGESGVSIITKSKETGAITGLSKSQSQFKNEAKYREQIANTPIVAGMTTSDINTIKQARQEVQARTLSKLTYPKDDKYADSDFFAAGATLNQNAQTMLTQKTTNTKTSPFKTKADIAVEKAVAEARKINPNGSKEYFEGVANVARRNEMSSTELLKSDLKRGLSILDTTASPYVKKVLPTDTKLAEQRSAVLTSVGLEDDRQKIVKKSGALGTAAGNVFNEGYNFVRDKPASSAVEAGKLYAEMELMGAGFNTIKIAGRGALTGIGASVESGATKILSNSGKLEAALTAARKEEVVAARAAQAASGDVAAQAAYKAAAAKTLQLESIAAKNNAVLNTASKVNRGFQTAAKGVNPTVDTVFEAQIANSLAKQGLGKSIGISQAGVSIETNDKNYEGLIKEVGKFAVGASAFTRGSRAAEGTISKAAPEFFKSSKAAEYNWSPASAAIGQTTYAAKSLVKGDIVPAIPFVKRATLTEVIGVDKYADFNYGHTVDVAGKTILTHVKGEGIRLRHGVAGAPAEALVKVSETGKIEPRVTQAFTKRETKFFKKTVERTSTDPTTESEYLTSALNIAKSANKVTRPITTPEKFEITSTAIPETARSSVTKAIKSYEGEIRVTGSVPMKAQADPFVTRKTHDLEIYGDDKAAIAEHIGKQLKADGIKDFTVDAKEGKISFKIDGVEDVGIEVFTHGTSKKAIENYKKEIESGSTSANSPKPKPELAFGYNSKQNIKIGSEKEGYVEVQDLAEQVVRKVAGSTMYRDSALQPAHPGRVKDIGDTITASVKFALNGKMRANDIVTFTNSAYTKFGSSPRDSVAGKQLKEAGLLGSSERLAEINSKGKNQTEAEKSEAAEIKAKIDEAGLTAASKTYINNMKFHKAFMEKVASDPVVNFIYKNQRLPTYTEASLLSDSLASSISDKQLLYDSAAKDVKTGNALVDEAIGKNENVLSTKKENPFTKRNEAAVKDEIVNEKDNLFNRKKDNPFNKKDEIIVDKDKLTIKRNALSNKTTTEKDRIKNKKEDIVNRDIKETKKEDLFGRERSSGATVNLVSGRESPFARMTIKNNKIEVAKIKPKINEFESSVKPTLELSSAPRSAVWNKTGVRSPASNANAVKPSIFAPKPASAYPSNVKPVLKPNVTPFSPLPKDDKSVSLASISASSLPSASVSTITSLSPSTLPSPSTSTSTITSTSTSTITSPSPSTGLSPSPSIGSSPSPYPGGLYPSQQEKKSTTDYDNFIPYNKKKPREESDKLLRRRKSGIRDEPVIKVANQALMISKTKVNTFGEMMGRTGEKAAYGEGIKVKKTERPSPFNKKVTMSTLESLTPVTFAIAEKPVLNKIARIAKTPVKVMEVKQKPKPKNIPKAAKNVAKKTKSSSSSSASSTSSSSSSSSGSSGIVLKSSNNAKSISNAAKYTATTTVAKSKVKFPWS